VQQFVGLNIVVQHPFTSEHRLLWSCCLAGDDKRRALWAQGRRSAGLRAGRLLARGRDLSWGRRAPGARLHVHRGSGGTGI